MQVRPAAAVASGVVIDRPVAGSMSALELMMAQRRRIARRRRLIGWTVAGILLLTAGISAAVVYAYVNDPARIPAPDASLAEWRRHTEHVVRKWLPKNLYRPETLEIVGFENFTRVTETMTMIDVRYRADSAAGWRFLVDYRCGVVGGEVIYAVTVEEFEKSLQEHRDGGSPARSGTWLDG